MIKLYLQDKKTLHFEFHKHEMPEEFSYKYETIINKIRYPSSYQGGAFANQVMGVYSLPLEFSGSFKGSGFDGSSVNVRANKLKQSLGAIFCIKAPVSDNGVEQELGPGLWILEKLDLTYKMGQEIVYSIMFTPHQFQDQLAGTKVKKLSVDPNKMMGGLAGASGGKKKGPGSGKRADGSKSGPKKGDTQKVPNVLNGKRTLITQTYDGTTWVPPVKSN